MGDDIEIAPRIARAISAAMARGVTVTLASGRSFPSMWPFARALKISSPLVCYQGGRICVPPDGRVLLDESVPLDATHRLLEHAQARDLDITVYLDDCVYTREIRRPREFYDRFFGLPIVVVDDLLHAVNRRPTKAIIIGEETENDRLLPELKARFGRQLQIIRSHRHFVEAVPLDVSKASALAWLAAELGVHQDETLAIGDGGNDVSMVAWAGLGVAMGNAVAEVRAVADWIAPTVEEHGAAVALERFVLDGEA